MYTSFREDDLDPRRVSRAATRRRAASTRTTTLGMRLQELAARLLVQVGLVR